MLLAGKSALITGSSSGIGEAVALAFARNGADRIVVNYPADAQAANAQAVVALLGSLGCNAIAVRADVSVEAEVAALFAEAEAFCAPPDIVVNNAGIGHDDAIEQLSVETWDRVMNVHLRGTFLVTRAALPAMYALDRGRIINTVSQLAFKGAPRLSAYTAAKGGIIAFTRSVALEIGSRNIRINCVAPGATRTPILDQVAPDVLEAVRASIPTGRIAETAEIAPAFVFLASAGGDHFQGQCISPNGGDCFL